MRPFRRPERVSQEPAKKTPGPPPDKPEPAKQTPRVFVRNSMLTASNVEALLRSMEERHAAIYEEGYNAGRSRAMRHMSDEPNLSLEISNPYAWVPRQGYEPPPGRPPITPRVGEVILINGIPNTVIRVRHDGTLHATPVRRSDD